MQDAGGRGVVVVVVGVSIRRDLLSMEKIAITEKQEISEVGGGSSSLQKHPFLYACDGDESKSVLIFRGGLTLGEIEDTLASPRCCYKN